MYICKERRRKKKTTGGLSPPWIHGSMTSTSVLEAENSRRWLGWRLPGGVSKKRRFRNFKQLTNPKDPYPSLEYV